MRTLFYKLPNNILKSWSGYNIALHFLAIISTYFLVISGFDWIYFQSTRDETLQKFLFPAVIIGGLMPIILPIILYTIGKIKKSPTTINTAFAITQAAALGWIISSSYKAFTGRIPPQAAMTNSLMNINEQFQFGFMRGGIFWGWPSSHTTIAFATAISLACLYPENKFIKYGAPLYALYIGIGISTNIHWFSEFFAGALIGTAIGIAVGTSFWNRSKTLISE